MKKKHWAIAAIAVIAVCMFANPADDCADGVCRPKRQRSLVSRVIDWAAWFRLAPINAEPPLPPTPPQPVRMAANRSPVRATGSDGNPEIDHSHGW